MARKMVFNKEFILEKANDFINEKGIDSLNARSLCKYIGCSTQPLFKNFNDMNELKTSLKKHLYNCYKDFVYQFVDKENYLFTSNFAYALFALEDANAFKILFMNQKSKITNDPLNIDTILLISKQYNLTKEQSKILYRDVNLYTHGLSCQIACKNITLNELEIKNLINNIINNLKDVI